MTSELPLFVSALESSHITSLIVGVMTVLGAVSGHLVSHLLGGGERQYRRAFDRALKQWEAQYKMVELTKGTGVEHVIKPLRYWLVAEVSLDAFAPRSYWLPQWFLDARLRRHKARIQRWFKDADDLEAAIYNHEVSRS
jgi:hypothetical protein